MASIFTLKQDVSELKSSNNGISKMVYQQQPPTRDITSRSFGNGAIHFRFNTSGQRWWVPSKSYIRMRMKLTKGDGTAVDTAFGVAPNMSMCPSMFQSGQFSINNKTISRVPDFMAQVDALETRLTKSKSWMDSIGNSTNWWQPDQSTRLAEVAIDGSIIKDTVPVAPTETVTADTNIPGYIAVNTIAYDADTGVITFAAGGGGAPANTNISWNVGDYFVFTAINTAVAGSLNVRCEVLATNAGPTMTVASNMATDVAAHAGNRYSRVVIQPAPTSPPSRQIGTFETIWQPPLSIFKVDHAIPPGGQQELILIPQTSNAYMQRAIESALGVASKEYQAFNATADATKFKLEVVDMYFYIAMVDGPRADNLTYLLDLEQTNCLSEKIDSVNFQQKSFDVPPSTYALTCAYQDLRAGDHTAISVSKFKSYEAGGVPATSQELKLTRFFVNYANLNLPQPDADPEYVKKTGGTTGIDYTTQRYVESQINSGGYHDTGGVETIEEFHERGQYIFQRFYKDGSDNSTRVTVNQQFSAGTDITNMNLLLFAHSRSVGRIEIQDGKISNIQVEQN